MCVCRLLQSKHSSLRSMKPIYFDYSSSNLPPAIEFYEQRNQELDQVTSEGFYHSLTFFYKSNNSSHFTLEIFQDCQCLQNYRVSPCPLG